MHDATHKNCKPSNCADVTAHSRPRIREVLAEVHCLAVGTVKVHCARVVV
jgi:hypothetical protein